MMFHSLCMKMILSSPSKKKVEVLNNFKDYNPGTNYVGYLMSKMIFLPGKETIFLSFFCEKGIDLFYFPKMEAAWD